MRGTAGGGGGGAILGATAGAASGIGCSGVGGLANPFGPNLARGLLSLVVGGKRSGHSPPAGGRPWPQPLPAVGRNWQERLLCGWCR